MFQAIYKYRLKQLPMVIAISACIISWLPTQILLHSKIPIIHLCWNCILCHWERGIVSKMIVFKHFYVKECKIKNHLEMFQDNFELFFFYFRPARKNSLFDNWFWRSLNLCTQISPTYLPVLAARRIKTSFSFFRSSKVSVLQKYANSSYELQW